MKNEKLYAALIAAFTIADVPEPSNEAIATELCNMLDAFAETIADAIVAAQPAALPMVEIASASCVDAEAHERDVLYQVVATAINRAHEDGQDMRAAGVDAAAAFRAGIANTPVTHPAD